MAGEWVEAVEAAFGALTPPHLEKKKATIIALVDARLAGRSEESVWRLPQTCNRGTYHMKWKHDPTFKVCLEEVDRLARQWKDSRTVRALQEAAERLALAAPIAVAKVMGLLASDDESVRLRAALGILDRAGMETATKTTAGVEVSDARERLARLLGVDGGGAADAAGGPEAGGAGGAER